MKQFAIILVGVIFLTSCDCYRILTGTIVNSQTGLPVQDARVYFTKQPNNSYITDSIGKYQLKYVGNGLSCYFKSKKQITIEKRKYRYKTITQDQQPIKIDPILFYINDTISSSNIDTLDAQTVYQNPSIKADYLGGLDAISDFISFISNSDCVVCGYKVTFIIDTLGHMRNIKINSYPLPHIAKKKDSLTFCSSLEREAEIMFIKLNNWMSAMHDGKKVYSRLTLGYFF